METYHLGWDVGSWHCKPTSKSRDVIAILHNGGVKFNKPGNLRDSIFKSDTAKEWIKSIFADTDINLPDNFKVIMAIDATLGFSKAFVDLINDNGRVNQINTFRTNEYLFRETEKFLYKEHKIKSLSAVQDRIGSQATKAIHVRSKFTPIRLSTGVWTNDDGRLTIIEAYPSSVSLPSFIQQKEYNDGDKRDAAICAHVAYLFDQQRTLLYSPNANAVDVPVSEGWIWTVCK